MLYSWQNGSLVLLNKRANQRLPNTRKPNRPTMLCDHSHLFFWSKMATAMGFLRVFAFLVLAPLIIIADGNDRHVKFEYKFSFKGPHLVNKDGSIPFWSHGGSKWIHVVRQRCCPRKYSAPTWMVSIYFLFKRADDLFSSGAIASDEQVRITPSLKDKKG